jgi:hypothetical protein
MPVEDSSILNEHQRGWERIMRNIPGRVPGSGVAAVGKSPAEATAESLA